MNRYFKRLNAFTCAFKLTAEDATRASNLLDDISGSSGWDGLTMYHNKWIHKHNDHAVTMTNGQYVSATMTCIVAVLQSFIVKPCYK